MEFQYIVNPMTNRKCSVNSRLGQQIISNYLYQLGGAPRAQGVGAPFFSDSGDSSKDGKKDGKMGKTDFSRTDDAYKKANAASKALDDK
uniref:Uncharacterized protein n=1 Tax=viral metagenome TaxID=1070528 RepID=A0A6C0JDA8_9ZZZZ